MLRPEAKLTNQTTILQSVSSMVTTTPLTINPKLKNRQIIFTARSEITAISPITAVDASELKESKQHNEITICRKLSTKKYMIGMEVIPVDLVDHWGQMNQ
ncbi:hypothetical protein QL285_076502 [Trifolium repens]|nr:hypothetical protein QL285_076502 [Trifolium repens]